MRYFKLELLLLILISVLLQISCSSGYYDTEINAKVYLDRQPPYRDGNGNAIKLDNNNIASDIKWSSLKEFIQTRNKPTYQDCAGSTHNNAEAEGIKAALVVTHFSHDDRIFMFNLFKTTDYGLVFVDCSGEDLSSVTPPPMIGNKTYGYASDDNKVAYVQVGQPLGFISIDVAENFGLDYSGYQKWQQRKSKFDDDYQAYQTEVSSRTMTRWNESSTGIFDRTPPIYPNDLATLEKLDQEAQPLGAFWRGFGIIKSIEIYW